MHNEALFHIDTCVKLLLMQLLTDDRIVSRNFSIYGNLDHRTLSHVTFGFEVILKAPFMVTKSQIF